MDSTLQLYLGEINETPLLTAEQEKDLARRIIQDNDMGARNRMVRSNLRLVVNIAKRFGDRGLPLADLIAEGNLGLLRAVERFDPEQGIRFSTYASCWIKQAIKRALINGSQPIHIPAYMVAMISRWKQIELRIEEDLGRTPNLEEMAKELKMPLRKVRIIGCAVKAFSSPNQMPASEESLTIDEMLEDSRTLRPEEEVFNRDELDTLRKLLDQIDEREAEVLRLRFGLNRGEPLTLKEIGKQVGLTRERVRQIEKEALEKLNKILHADQPPDA